MFRVHETLRKITYREPQSWRQGSGHMTSWRSRFTVIIIMIGVIVFVFVVVFIIIIIIIILFIVNKIL